VIQHSELLLFADDIKLFLRICTTDDCKLLQHDLDSVAHWAQRLGLELSIPKCHTMTYTRCNERVLFTYTINGIALKQPGDSVIDLGITFDRSLTSRTHIESYL